MPSSRDHNRSNQNSKREKIGQSSGTHWVVDAALQCLTRLVDLIIILSAQDRTPDPNHHYRRAYTERYRAKKRVVYYFWVTSLLCMLVVPTVGFVTTAGLFTTFISFSYLDETDENDEVG